MRNLYEKTQGSPFSYFCEAFSDCNIEFQQRATDFDIQVM